MKRVEILKKDLIHNIGIIKAIAKENGPNDNGEETKVIAVVKGNGYGLGMVEYTKFLIEHGFDFFAIATVEEALILRGAGIEQKILILTSTCIKKDVEKLIDNNITLAIGSPESAKIADEVAKERGIELNVHLKVDTGMGRYGFIYSKPEEIVMTIKNLENIKIEGMFSHFSRSFNPDRKLTEVQFKRFIDIVEILKMNDIEYGMLHICNSEAFLKYPDMHLNAVRIGSAFLGRIFSKQFNLKVVGTFKTEIMEIKVLPKGYTIGYGNTYKTKRETKTGIIPVGYSDGFNMDNREQLFSLLSKIRTAAKAILKNENQVVKIAGIRYKVLGQIGTNFAAIDITKSNIEVGQEVELDTRPTYINSIVERKYI